MRQSPRRSAASIILAGAVVAALTLPMPASAAPTGPRVALQAGHWQAREAPFPLSISTGGSTQGVEEWRINLDVAQRTASVLRASGIEVEVLPSWFPKGYAADAFVSLHVNGSPNGSHRGFFADRAEDSAIPAEEDRLVSLINSAYAQGTPIPYVYRPTRNSRRYYGYYRVTDRTPAALIEMGFLTDDTDRAFLTESPQKAADALALGIKRFLDGAGATSAGSRSGTIRLDPGTKTAALRAEPTRRSAALARIPAGADVSLTGRTVGEEVEPSNDQWVAVRWQGYRGYVYSGLIVE
ncbi:MAG TPA: N-acetylmuramoyl-L-alanine amidase [Dehalococcoidia bacterium]|nr:N-acetylmuramoyl-L-alanine amidase [Dehalococcoidia bacterium]